MGKERVIKMKKIIILILGILTLSSCKIGLNEKEQEFCNVIEDPVFESIFVYKGILKLNVEYKNEHGKFINDSIEACENRNLISRNIMKILKL